MRYLTMLVAALGAVSVQACALVTGLGDEKQPQDAPHQEQDGGGLPEASTPDTGALDARSDVVPGSDGGIEGGIVLPNLPLTEDAFVAGDVGLVGIEPDDRSVYSYDKTKRTWNVIGRDIAKLTLAAGHIYGLSNDFSAVLQYSGTPGPWQQIGDNVFSSFVPNCPTLYGVALSNQFLLAYDPTNNQWGPGGAPGGQFVCNTTTLYGLSIKGDVLFQRLDTQWSQVSSTPKGTMYAGGSALVVTDPATSDLYLYGGTQDQFTRLTGPSTGLVIGTNDEMYRLAGSDGTISQLDGSNETVIGKGATRLYIAGTDLYAFDSTKKTILAYGGSPMIWNDIKFPHKP